MNAGTIKYSKPGIQRLQVQALADISLSDLCCHSNIANPPTSPTSAQLEGTPAIPPSYIRVRAVAWECGDGQTDRQTDTQTAVANIHFASATPHAKYYC